MTLRRWLMMAGLLLGTGATVLGAEKVVAGPRGGRYLGTDLPRPEFLVLENRKVSVKFYDAAGKPVAPAGRTVAVVAQAKPSTVTLATEAESGGEGLVTKEPLPAGNGYTVVVQVRETPEAKPRNFRMKLDLEMCGECKHQEYACTCAH